MKTALVISDFNADLVARLISSDKSGPQVACTSTGFGQLYQNLAQAQPEDDQSTLFVWSRPEGIFPDYTELYLQSRPSAEAVNAAVDHFADLLIAAAGRFGSVLVSTWIRTEGGRGSGLLDWQANGQARVLAAMNLRLAERLDDQANICLLDTQRWLDATPNGRDPRFWFAMKTPFTDTVARAAARDVKAAIRAFSGATRKLIILDLDDTLWGGVVGETDFAGLQLGGHDAAGEAFVEFQKALKTLSRRGIALAVVSKNTEAVALEAIDQHPEMVLRREDLAGWRINWNDKAENVISLTKELNLGLDAVVFIDDNPTERGRVAEACPDVLVPDWPRDPTRYATALRELDCFDQVALTDEDRRRVEMYAVSRERTAAATTTGSPEDWLNGLGITVAVEPVGKTNLARLVQLANKTNQMNALTRRFTETEFSNWLSADPSRQTNAVRVADRFGDLGLTGVVSWERNGGDLHLADFLLSCRAMGRQVENLMVHLAVEAARAQGAEQVVMTFQPTARNAPCLDFWRQSGFEETAPNVFTWPVAKPYAAPPFIALETVGAEPVA